MNGDARIAIRPTLPEDVPGLRRVVDETGLFPSEMLPDLLAGFLTGEPGGPVWLTALGDGGPVGFCYAAPEALAEGTWNMLAIGVSPSVQGRGAGTALVGRLEEILGAEGQRVLIADTSGTEAFDRTREFYRRANYVEEARIRDFWGPGDDKVVFWKRLSRRPGAER